MKQKRVQGVDLPRLRQEAGEVLWRNANRLTLILAIMVAVSPLMFYLSVWSVFHFAVLPLFPQAELFGCVLMILVMLCLSQFLTLPLLTGLLHMASEMESGREVILSDVFYAFSEKRNYKVALRLSYAVLWRMVLLIAAEGCIYWLFFALSGGTLAVMLMGIPIYVGVFILWFRLAARSFLLPYFAMTLPEAAPRMRPYARSVGSYYWIGFFPWIVLSLLTFGILMLADTLPKMLIAYFRLCRKLNELTTQSEDLIK